MELKKSDYELSQTEGGHSIAPSTIYKLVFRLWLDLAGLSMFPFTSVSYGGQRKHISADRGSR